MNPVMALLVTALLLLGNGFFVAAEFALIAARRTQLEIMASSGSVLAVPALRAVGNLSRMIAGVQLGVTVCSLALGAIAEPAIAHLLEPVAHRAGLSEGLIHPVALVIALSIVVVLHVVVGEMVPKNFALAGPERAALVLAPPLSVIVWLTRPLIWLVNAMAFGALRLVGITPRDEVESAFTHEQVAAMVEEAHGEGLLAAGEYDRLSGALGFSELEVSHVVLPADQLAIVRQGSTAAEVEQLCAATGFSRFPVANDAGDILGYLHIKDVLELDEVRRQRPVADKWIRPLANVAVTDRLHDALESLQRKGSHMARVVDHGGFVGVVTLEDVLEELVGEIRDAAHTD